MLFFFNFSFIKESWKKVSQVSNTDNKSALHKMHFKVYYHFDQINAIFFCEQLFLRKKYPTTHKADPHHT